MSKVATIEIIKNVKIHTNAEALEIAEVLGWSVCVKKNEFKIGDKCVYIQTDSILDDRPEYEFLRNKSFRIKTMKLRGERSQGICFKLSVFNLPEDTEVGSDVSELVGAKHYEKPISAQLAGSVRGHLPSFLIRTDEDSIKNYPELINEFTGKLCYLAIKADGSSGTAYLKDELFGVCSRNLDLKEEEGNSFWKVARQYNLEQALRNFRNLYPGDYSCNFELVGPGVQGNPMNLPELTIRVFNLFSIDKHKYAHFETLVEFCNDNNLPMVEVVWAGKFNFSLKDLVDMANKAEYSKGVLAEGLVLRSIQEQESLVLKGRLSCKIVSEEYCLKHNQ